MPSLDIQANLKATRYTRGEMVLRVLWLFGQVCFKLSPRPMFGFRRWLLRLFGAKVGKNVHIYPSTTIYFPWQMEIGEWSSIGEWALIYNLGKVIIGEKATISHRAHLCAGTHDYSDPLLPLIRPTITIQSQAWICADAFVCPGITVGEGAVVGACSVVTKDVKPWTVVAGNPAKFIKVRELRP